jgi:hypothetical protein
VRKTGCCRALLASVVLAEWSASLCEEALAFKVLFAVLWRVDWNENICTVLFAKKLSYSAVEALRVIVVVQRLDPSVAGFNGEAAREALGRKQLIPVGLTVGLALLQEERIVAEQLAAVSALEALRMELLANGVQAISLRRDKQSILATTSTNFVSHLNFSVAFAAWRRQELLEAVFAVQVALLLNEADVHEFALAVGVHAQEVSRAPCLSEGCYEWSSARSCAC